VYKALVRLTVLGSALSMVACQGGTGGGSTLPTTGQAMSARQSTGARFAAVHPAKSLNWRQYRFDNDHTGFNPKETILNKSNVPQLQLSWQAQLGNLVDYSSPAVVNGVAYLASSDGVLWAYSANGCGQSLCTSPMWQSTQIAQMIDSPTVAGGFVYVGSQTSFSSNAGKLDVFSATGCGQSVCAPLWQGLAGDQSILMSSPTVARGMVYVGSHDGKVYAFDANGCGQSTCNPIWTGQTGGSIESTATVANGVLYIGSDDGNLYAFKAQGCGSSSCSPLWTGALGYPIFESSPAVVKGVVYISSQHNLAAFKAKSCGKSTCTPLWQATDSVNFFNGSPAVAKGRVYIGQENGIAVYRAKGCSGSNCSPLWTGFGAGRQAAVASSPTVANGVVYAGRNTGEVLAWPAAGCGQSFCTQIWSGTTNDPLVTSSPTVINGQVYIGSADNSFPSEISGRLYVFALPDLRSRRH
jgi:outer membrane protein assembly factor BamB